MEADIAPILAKRHQHNADNEAARAQLADWQRGHPGEVWRSGDAMEGD